MPDINIEMVEPIAWLMSKPKRVKIAVGGRGSTKSTGMDDAMLVYCDAGQRICGTREFQNSIDDSIHQNLSMEIERHGIEGFQINSNNIKSHSGGEIFYKGLARNITSLKSLAGVNKLRIEEGESVSIRSLRVLTPSIRSSALDTSRGEGGEPPEIWISMNRNSREDAIAKKYLARAESTLKRCGRYEDDLMMVVELNWRDNPWFPPELELERLDDKSLLSDDEYSHIWDGDYDESVERNIIKRAWFDSAIDAHLKLGVRPVGANIFSFDPSDEGDDPKGWSYRQGILVKDAGEYLKVDAFDGCDLATGDAIALNTDLFVFDADGMGALLRRQIADNFKGHKCEIRAYRGSNAVEEKKAKYDGVGSLGRADKPKTNEETFSNKRSQFYMKLAQRFYNTYLAVEKKKLVDPDSIISISSDIKLLNKLRSEICRLPRKPNGAGKIQLMSKQEMKTKYGIDSPNMADSLAMSEEIPSLEIIEDELEFDSWG